MSWHFCFKFSSSCQYIHSRYLKTIFHSFFFTKCLFSSFFHAGHQDLHKWICRKSFLVFVVVLISMIVNRDRPNDKEWLGKRWNRFGRKVQTEAVFLRIFPCLSFVTVCCTGLLPLISMLVGRWLEGEDKNCLWEILLCYRAMWMNSCPLYGCFHHLYLST